VPSSADISDVAYLLSLGYRTFMLGDEVCQRRDSVIAALNLLNAIVREVL
jgi:pyruvate kinase